MPWTQDQFTHLYLIYRFAKQLHFTISHPILEVYKKLLIRLLPIIFL